MNNYSTFARKLKIDRENELSEENFNTKRKQDYKNHWKTWGGGRSFRSVCG